MQTAAIDTTRPLKRHEALKPLSRDHHDGLLLCWKIRRGLQKKVSPERMSSYTKHFFSARLWPHFAHEERDVFPLLGKSELVRQAKEEHRRLGQLFLMHAPDAAALDLTQQLLEKHIRFEERVLFNELQEKVTGQELEKALAHHEAQTHEEDWADEFWQ